eukprot:scaffold317_cov260-Pinguiococcus_pyrenoidosus.AAC.33
MTCSSWIRTSALSPPLGFPHRLGAEKGMAEVGRASIGSEVGPATAQAVPGGGSGDASRGTKKR